MAEILILGEKVETKNIYEIYDVERDKKMFLNPKAGFVIKFIDGSKKIFTEDIAYESYPGEIYNIKDKWEVLQQAVYDEWQKDKHSMKEFNL